MSTQSIAARRLRLTLGRGSGWQAPAAAVLILVVGLWLAFDVSPGDVALFIGYELGFLVAPGWLAYVAISGRRHSPLREISIGWALGHVLEIGAFSLTAALHARGWLAIYPVVVIAASLAVIRLERVPLRTSLGSSADRASVARFWWVIAAVIGIALVYTALINFAQLPLPGPAGFKGWFIDDAFHLDVSAEALHHWPIHSPEVSGISLPYQNFVYMHMAAVAQITGIALPVVVLRLTIVPLLILTVLSICWAAKELTGDTWAGPLAAALILLVGEVNPTPHLIAAKFLFLLITLASPTALLGLIMFVPVVVLLAGRIGAKPAPVNDRRTWVMLALLLAGCAGSKGSILPVLIGGVVLYILATAVHRRKVERNAVAALGLLGVLSVVSYLLFYGGHSEGLTLNLKGIASQSRSIIHFGQHLASIPGATGVFYVVANVIVVIALGAAPLAGLTWLARDRRLRLAPTTFLLLGLFVAGLVPVFFTTAPGTSTVWFLYYGFVAATLLSAHGLCLFWRNWRSRPAVGRVLLAGLPWAIAICATAYVGYKLKVGTAFELLAWLAVAGAVVAVVWLVRDRAGQAPRLRACAWIMLPLLVAGILDLPMHIAPETVEAGVDPLYANDWGYVPGGLVEGLDWVRAHTGPNAVLAVNNYNLTGPPGLSMSEPEYMYYSALSERQVFLEGWFETDAIINGGPDSNPFPVRRKLNDAVFHHADPRALRILSTRYGVRYLIVDKVNGTADPALGSIATLAYANRAVAIYSTRP